VKILELVLEAYDTIAQAQGHGEIIIVVKGRKVVGVNTVTKVMPD